MTANHTLIQTIRLLAYRPTSTFAASRCQTPGTFMRQTHLFMAELDQHLRRPITLSMPCCPCLSADETALTGLVAAAQSHRHDEVAARAAWLVHNRGVPAVTACARELAATLSIAGLFLDPVMMAPVPKRAAPLALLGDRHNPQIRAAF